MTAALADSLRKGFLGVFELLDKTLITRCFFNRSQILALNVLDQRNFKRFAIAEFLDDDGNLAQRRLLGRAPTPFSGDDLVGIGLLRVASNELRLQDALFSDRVDQRCV